MNQAVTYSPVLGQKPGMVTAIAVMTLVNGILNILWSVGFACAVLSFFWAVLPLLCLPLAIYPLVLGILEIIYAAKLIPNPPKPTQPAKWLAIMEICDIVVVDVPSLVIGILSLVFYNDSRVQAYFAALNSQPLSASSYQSSQQC
jgi:hypothetical protein